MPGFDHAPEVVSSGKWRSPVGSGLSLSLDDRVVLVTGGTRGVGLGISAAFHDAGATVVTCSRSPVDEPPGARHIACDVRSPEAVEAMIEEILEQYGRLDVLVN